VNLIQNFTITDLTLIGLGLTLFNYSLYYLYCNSIPFLTSSKLKVLESLSLKDYPDSGYENILRDALINKISINSNKERDRHLSTFF
jgi:hypothetical protein